MLLARRHYLPLFLSAVLGWTLSPSVVHGRPQDQPHDKSAKHKDDNDKAAKKQARTTAGADLLKTVWVDPGDIGSLDLVNGAGGAEHAPRHNAEYVFVKEDMNGTSPKFYIKDDRGVEWLLKLGEEPKSETAATRFVWAMGYFADEDYFVPTIHVSQIPKLHRGSKDITGDGTVTNARLKRQDPGVKKAQDWSWYNNPFTNTREFNGLRVMMALINNWDLKTVNNKVYVTDTEERYVVSDLGASFGRTGAAISRSKAALKDYEDSKFIRDRKHDTVSFEMRTRPFPLLAPFEPKNYEKRASMEDIVSNIPVADAAWIGSQLAKLRPEQIRDAFRTAGFEAEEVEGYARTMEKRISDLNSLETFFPARGQITSQNRN